MQRSLNCGSNLGKLRLRCRMKYQWRRRRERKEEKERGRGGKACSVSYPSNTFPTSLPANARSHARPVHFDSSCSFSIRFSSLPPTHTHECLPVSTCWSATYSDLFKETVLSLSLSLTHTHTHTHTHSTEMETETETVNGKTSRRTWFSYVNPSSKQIEKKIKKACIEKR